MWESAAPLLVAEDQRRVLEGWRRAPSTPQGVALRASVILMAADGVPNRTIAKTLGVSRPTVLLWRERFARDGPKALTKTEKARGRKPYSPPDKVIYETSRSVNPSLDARRRSASHRQSWVTHRLRREPFMPSSAPGTRHAERDGKRPVNKLYTWRRG